ncbi:MAG: hypothetical protein GX980_09500 [Firmicutes bacterium]|nr:hypothetical protein [Bacillota bacterium]
MLIWVERPMSAGPRRQYDEVNICEMGVGSGLTNAMLFVRILFTRMGDEDGPRMVEKRF